MKPVKRLHVGGCIDRTRALSFTFNGKKYTGYQGDTLASALLANGISVVARSWKYHRPRGIIGCGAEEPNAIMQIELGKHTIPNVRATQAELYAGMVVNSVNAWPSVNVDMMALVGLFSKMLPAGFYYKTFMWPRKLWMTYEQVIRHASGLGKAPASEDPDYYEKTNVHCDVLVVGAGPTGLMAALAAGKAGARVVLADEQAESGGRLLTEKCTIGGQESQAWLASLLSELKAMENVHLLNRSTVFGYHDGNFATINERLTDHLPLANRNGAREKMWRVRARKIILATGSHERPMVFANNDRPGIMLASAVSTYLNHYAVKLANTAVIFTNNDSAYQTVLDLLNAGVEVAAVIESRSSATSSIVKEVRKRGVQVYANSVVVNVAGKKRITSVQIKSRSSDGNEVLGNTISIACDLLAMSGGWNPAVHLFAQSGGKPEWDNEKHCFVPDIVVQEQISAGAANGSFGLAVCLQEGVAAGECMAKELGFELIDRLAAPDVGGIANTDSEPLWRVPVHKKPGRGAKQFIDFQNDVGVSDIFLAAREGYKSIEHVKRYTALGFGTDQGKVGNINGMAVLAEALGQSISSTGTTTFRPNYTPVTFGAIAGSDTGPMLFDPVRKTAMHRWHEKQGALFENVGQWKRPWYYPKGNETMYQAVNRECLATRNSVGIMDASTLGKIEIIGPDAAEFLNRIYTNAWKKTGINCARYGFMLGEDGMVLDDGVTVRLDQNRFFMHTTTGGAASVLSWMERWLQTEWPELQVYLTSVTDHWATAAVVGPNSRKVVSTVCDDIDFDAQSFPFMTSRTGTVDGVPVRVNRISFSGELAYEVNVSAHYGQYVWEKLIAAGKPWDITPYGTETMHVLRAEKGYIIVGQDTDGSVTPVDLGMNWVLSKTKDYLGRRSLNRVDCLREDRKQLVGLLTRDPYEVLPEGGQITDVASTSIPVPMSGHVTSSYYSATLERSIAMALVKGGLKRQGDTVYVPLADGRIIPAEITSSVFYDPNGERQNV